VTSSAGTPSPAENGFALAAGWWPVGHATEVVAKPRAVRLGDQEIVLYRDREGAAHALLDRCPHRRLPLSMGRLTDNGLQCGYHGWTFDGASGQCTVIPNFRPDETPSRRIKVAAYPVAEAQGYVFVWTGAGAPSPATPPIGSAGPGLPPAAGGTVHGTARVRAPHTRIAEALLLNPGAGLGLGWLLGGGDEMLGPEASTEDGAVTVRRDRLTLDLPRVGTFDPVADRTTTTVTTTHAATGLTVVTADSPAGGGTVRVLIGLTPDGGHRTTVRWRIQAHGGGARLLLSAVLLAEAGIRLTGRAVRALETVADGVESAYDPALDRLRELRLPPQEHLPEETVMSGKDGR
jgi:nitrite reductase/ring-hydroxylating ferredoxin subunit